MARAKVDPALIGDVQVVRHISHVPSHINACMWQGNVGAEQSAFMARIGRFVMSYISTYFPWMQFAGGGAGNDTSGLR